MMNGVSHGELRAARRGRRPTNSARGRRAALLRRARRSLGRRAQPRPRHRPRRRPRPTRGACRRRTPALAVKPTTPAQPAAAASTTDRERTQKALGIRRVRRGHGSGWFRFGAGGRRRDRFRRAPSAAADRRRDQREGGDGVDERPDGGDRRRQEALAEADGQHDPPRDGRPAHTRLLPAERRNQGRQPERRETSRTAAGTGSASSPGPGSRSRRAAHVHAARGRSASHAVTPDHDERVGPAEDAHRTEAERWPAQEADLEHQSGDRLVDGDRVLRCGRPGRPRRSAASADARGRRRTAPRRRRPA